MFKKTISRRSTYSKTQKSAIVRQVDDVMCYSIQLSLHEIGDLHSSQRNQLYTNCFPCLVTFLSVFSCNIVQCSLCLWLYFWTTCSFVLMYIKLVEFLYSTVQQRPVIKCLSCGNIHSSFWKKILLLWTCA